MAVQQVLRMGHPMLRAVAQPVAEFNTAELHALVADMLETMATLDGVGLAAPQIGVAQRVVVFGVADNVRYPDADKVPVTVLINPEVEVLDSALLLLEEGCLSVPGLRGQVPRPTCIRYQGMNQYGTRVEREAEGFHARVVLHEVDHLNGVLYPQRIRDFSQFGFAEELAVTVA